MTPLQIMVARNVLRDAGFLLVLRPERELHVHLARKVRDTCATALGAFEERPRVTEDDRVTVDEVFQPFAPQLGDVQYAVDEIEHGLATGYPRQHLANDIAWLGLLAHLHLVRAELALPAQEQTC